MPRLLVSPQPKVISTAPTQVEAVMTKRVLALSPDNSFEEAVAMMANHPFRHLLIIDAGGRLAGLISDRDLLRALIRAPDWNNTPVTELMTRDPVVVGLKTPLSAAVRRILLHRVNCLPVTDSGGRVHGIVTSTDLLKTFLRLQRYIERAKPKKPRRKKRVRKADRLDARLSGYRKRKG